MLEWGKNWGWGKKVAVVLAILMVLNIPKFIEIYGMFQDRPQGPVSSSEHPMFGACLKALRSPAAGPRSNEAAFCNCYTAAAIFQDRQENPYSRVADDDFPLLLAAIEGERPGRTAPLSPLPRALPAEIEGFVAAVVPHCRGRAIAWADYEKRKREGAEPQPRTASNRPAGGLHDFHESCGESQGVSWQGASIAQKALCQCYYVESRRRDIAAKDLPALLEAIDGKPSAVAGDRQQVDAFLRDSLPRCRKRSAAIAASTNR
jgi:hypothetical protein